MANKIAKIQVLEDLIDNRYHVDSNGQRVQIGQYWSILQIYFAMQEIGISINTLCTLASMLTERMDSKYNKTTKDINPLLFRKYLHLETMPIQISHTTITKTIAKGTSGKTLDSIRQILLQNNSFGDTIMHELENAIQSGKGEFVSSKVSTMGMSDFTAVLKMSILLLDMKGYLQDMPNNKKHVQHIITKIKEYHDDASRESNRLDEPPMLGLPL